MKEISDELYQRLLYLGIINENDTTREGNVGTSDYSKSLIQPWTIWLEYQDKLTPWDTDIIKRVLRTKVEEGKTMVESRILDYQKIIHICQERLRQLNILLNK